MELISNLVGVKLDPLKNAESLTVLPLLGAEVVSDFEKKEVKVAVDAKKAETWRQGLRDVRESQRLPDWKAAKFAGRLQFSVGLNFGKVGRAFIRPLHARACAPIPGDQLSQQGDQRCRWLENYLSIRPVAVIRALKPKRELVSTWTDAAGNRSCAVFLWSVNRGWHYSYWRMPKSVLRKLLPRRNDQITYLELAAVILAFTTFQGWLTQAAWTAWVDNQGVVGALLKGGARASDVNAVIGQLWLNIAKLGIALQIGRVASKANIADEPTRGCKDWIEKSGATFHEPLIPEWLLDPWCAPDMAPEKLL